MCLNIIDATRVHASVVERCRDHGCLAVHAGRSETRFGSAVVVDGDAANDGENLVAVGKRIAEFFQEHHSGTVAENRSLRVCIEGPGVPVRGQHRAFLIQISAAWRTGNRRATGQGHVALAAAQTRHRLCYRDQRCRARSVYADRRAGEVQAIGHTRGDVIFFVGKHDLKLTQLRDSFRVAHDVSLIIAGVVHATENTHWAWTGIGCVSTAFEAFPAKLQKDALLRIHQFGFPRRNAEEGRIEHLDIVNDAASLHICGIGAQLCRNRGIDFIVLKKRDALATLAKILPERFNVRSTRKTPAHRDDGDRITGGIRFVAWSFVRQPGRWNIAVAVVADSSSNGGGCRVAEKNGRCDWSCHFALQAGKRLHHQQRIATQLEKVIQPTCAINAEQFCKEVAYHLLRIAQRSQVGLCQFGAAIFRSRQRAAVKLAVGRDWKLVQQNVIGRHHEIR